ncbi:hypothetical protein [Sphingomonas rubra]|uniref:HNH endonuclease n=1 Tax=Sphingomonas rubra TaxID=634430 RepID=A0A1I5THV8_9SPHN|nr:hypothetical protein [Sphingomonas rubra]SFP81976.1 hypothetical protein SAMN04488241_1085 [Sphingomonas rubra]
MARRSKHDPYDHLPQKDDAAAEPVPCWLCGRPTGKTIVWHHPIPKSRGGRDVVPMHSICQQTLTANFTNSELQRHGMEVAGLLDNANVRRFVDWVAKKDPDFTATITKKQR